MSQIDRAIIEQSLIRKGFVLEETHHRYYYHEVNGKRSRAYTYVSTGSKYKSYGDSLFKRMKKELCLDTLLEVRRLLHCEMDGAEYNEILKSKGLI
ncbi:MAG TPA: hypothetical protein VJ044_13800 [Candidatus Hodarchaeales archaeon]|nr:hypothetical protein [Candidatus Hodarchaeales archaeon]